MPSERSCNEIGNTHDDGKVVHLTSTRLRHVREREPASHPSKSERPISNAILSAVSEHDGFQRCAGQPHVWVFAALDDLMLYCRDHQLSLTEEKLRGVIADIKTEITGFTRDNDH